MRALAISLSAALAATASTACVHERTKEIGYVKAGALAPPIGHGDDPPTRESTRSRAPHAPLPSSPSAVSAGTAAPPVEERRVATSVAPPAHRPLPAGETLEDRARTKFLASTTDVSADRATLYVPRAYAGEVSREGATVVRLRRLTVRAGQLNVVVRDDNPDLQLSARGGVSFRSDQPASVIEETGLRSLLLKNDGYTPLR